VGKRCQCTKTTSVNRSLWVRSTSPHHLPGQQHPQGTWEELWCADAEPNTYGAGNPGAYAMVAVLQAGLALPAYLSPHGVRSSSPTCMGYLGLSTRRGSASSGSTAVICAVG